ncbi:hypothetical protein SSPSH_002889 [Salinisphaera shabanensis E1L3A]|uniref:Uncharacterized protein n=1 Tax=Salinisphaera shabanensis E1L3A TaxID=1033802 RepID=U2E2Z6_9GAMM|nr:hypothetical protein SSPSH_002889 [Salinisphaera shabanensis E1L3A]
MQSSARRRRKPTDNTNHQAESKKSEIREGVLMRRSDAEPRDNKPYRNTGTVSLVH